MKHLFIIILFLLAPFRYMAAVIDERYNFESLILDDGLSNLLVNVFYEDDNGIMWFGTENSVDSYDGDKFIHYKFENGVFDLLRVTALVQYDGEYYVSNKQGLWRINRLSRVIERFLPERINFPVNSMYVDSINHTLYLATDKGLYLMRENKVKQLLKEANAISVSNVMLDIDADADGLLWLVTGTGLSSFNPITQTYHDYPAPPAYGMDAVSMSALAVLGDKVYIATRKQGIVTYDMATGIYADGPDVGCRVVTSISTDKEERIYVSTDGNGVHFIDHLTGRVVSSILHDPLDPHSIRSNATYSVYVDKADRMVWIGSYQDGVNYTPYKNDFLQVYRFGDRFTTQGMQVRSFYFRGYEKLIGTRNGLYYIDEKRGDILTYGADEMTGVMVFDICYYCGEYYIGTYAGGISVLNPHTRKMRRLAISGVPESMIRSSDIFCFRESPDGVLWIGTSEGVVCYDGTTRQGTYYTDANSALPKGNVMDILFDSTGKCWIATDNGLCIYDPSRRRMMTDVFPDNFGCKERVRVIYEAFDGKIYFLPDIGSLFRSNADMSDFERLPFHPLLKGKGFFSIAQTPDSLLWLSSDDGLLSYDLRDMSSKLYAKESGLPSTVFTYATAEVVDSVLWMGNTQGLVYFDFKQKGTDRAQSVKKNIINRVYVNGKEVQPNAFVRKSDTAPMLKVDQKKGNVTFSFVQLSYADQKSMTYEYMLEGYDSQWNYQRGTREISYYRLPSGDYTFRIRTPGVPASEASLRLKVVPSYSIPVIVLAVLLAALSLFAAIYIYGMRSRIDRLLRSVREYRRIQYEKELRDRQDSENKYKSVNISPEECKALHKKLIAHLRKSRCYTDPELKLTDLARDLNVNTYMLSYLFSQYLQCSYYDFVNTYRVEEFKHAVETGTYRKYTLSALAERCGFSSRASFFRSFKKVTGETPNEYIKRQEK